MKVVRGLGLCKAQADIIIQRPGLFIGHGPKKIGASLSVCAALNMDDKPHKKKKGKERRK